METSKPNIFVIQVDQLKPVMPCAYCNGAEFPSSIATFANYLRALNYLTCLVGQMHFVGADQLNGFEQRLTTDIYPADFNWTELRSGHSNNSIAFDARINLSIGVYAARKSVASGLTMMYRGCVFPVKTNSLSKTR